VAAIPSGWRLVAYEASRGACPSGYASHDAYIGATANAGACTCGCTIGTPPNCTTGPVPTLFGNGGFGGNQCNGQGATLQASGSTCAPLQQGGSLAQLFSAQAITFSGGTCTGTASGDPSQVTKQGVRTCDVTSKDAESVCEGNAPQSFSACIESDGDVPCPAGSPFSNKTSVADDEMLVCSGCTSCTVSGSCANAQVQFFGDAQCAKSVTAPLAASGQCVPTNASGKNVVAFEYTAQTNATCQAAGTSASFTPVMPRTICCR
jgi:hypothetical protein